MAISTWGFSVDLANKNPFLMGGYAVVESFAKLVASGGNHKNARLSFQEYFEKLGADAVKWGKPLQALLGALEAQLEFETAAIGGKDSMSGSFENLHVPPTLISFACAVGELKNIISPEIKSEGSYLYLAEHVPNANGGANYTQLNAMYTDIHQRIVKGDIISAQTIKDGGLAAALFKMAVGNGIGAAIQYHNDCFMPLLGSLILESKVELAEYTLLGKTGGNHLSMNDIHFDIAELSMAWENTLEPIFPAKSKNVQATEVAKALSTTTSIRKPNTVQTPRVFIPIFPGTNCEYETEHVFVDAGAEVHTALFRNYNEKAIQESIATFISEISAAQIMMIPGGFSAGDEPDGSAKYIVSVLKNSEIKEAVHALLKRGGLILGICNGFSSTGKIGITSLRTNTRFR